jgi:putative membrane protein
MAVEDLAHGEKAVGVSTNLSVERTRLSYERTLMSWVRTSTSLITFGFTIYKFFQIEMAKAGSRIGMKMGPTAFALLMIVIGLVSLLLATLDHRQALSALNAQYPGGKRSLARVLAVLISGLGVAALVMVLFRQ